MSIGTNADTDLGPSTFATSLMAALGRANPHMTLAYEPNAFALSIVANGDKGRLDLARPYGKYRNLSASDRPVFLDEYAQNLDAVTKRTPPTTYADAMPLLRPKIVTRAEAERERLGHETHAATDLTATLGLIGEHLAIAFELDYPEATVRVSQQMMREWGVTAGDMLAASVCNLSEEGLNMVRQPSGLYVPASENWHSPSFLLLTDEFRRLKVKGEIIAMAAGPRSFFVAGSEDTIALRDMAWRTLSLQQSPDFVSGIPLRLSSDGWQTYRPADNAPEAKFFHDLEVLTLTEEYAMQMPPLIRRALESNRDEYPPAVFLSNIEGRQKSMSNWTCGCSALLPRSDYICFMDHRRDACPILGVAPWADVWSVMGASMEAMGLYPERYKVSIFPTEADFAKFRLTPVDPNSFHLDPESVLLEALRTAAARRTAPM